MPINTNNLRTTAIRAAGDEQIQASLKKIGTELLNVVVRVLDLGRAS